MELAMQNNSNDETVRRYSTRFKSFQLEMFSNTNQKRRKMRF